MCRIFGFRSVIQSAAHRSLVAADNALGDQSSEHPDGWGVAYYVDDAPHVTRSPNTALTLLYPSVTSAFTPKANGRR